MKLLAILTLSLVSAQLTVAAGIKDGGKSNPPVPGKDAKTSSNSNPSSPKSPASATLLPSDTRTVAKPSSKVEKENKDNGAKNNGGKEPPRATPTPPKKSASALKSEMASSKLSSHTQPVVPPKPSGKGDNGGKPKATPTPPKKNSSTSKAQTSVKSTSKAMPTTTKPSISTTGAAFITTVESKTPVRTSIVEYSGTVVEQTTEMPTSSLEWTSYNYFTEVFTETTANVVGPSQTSPPEYIIPTETTVMAMTSQEWIAASSTIEVLPETTTTIEVSSESLTLESIPTETIPDAMESTTLSSSEDPTPIPV